MSTPKRRVHSFDEQLTCFTYYVMGMTMEQIAEQRPPSLRTLHRWAKEQNWPARKAAIDERVAAIFRDELVQRKGKALKRVWEIVDHLLAGMDDPEVLSGASLKDRAITFGILVEKAQMIAGDVGEEQQTTATDILADLSEQEEAELIAMAAETLQLDRSRNGHVNGRPADS